MARVSRRAARAEARGGQPNALFVLAGIESPPVELIGRADLVTVLFPWGSLLDGVLGRDPRAMAGLASLVAPGGALDAFVSVEPHDGLADLARSLTDGARLADCWAELGLGLVEHRLAGATEIAATGSSWARRLGAANPGGRPVTRFRLTRLP
jgi:16S rRNA (adenine(1408)-N(1))-methyltransferase